MNLKIINKLKQYMNNYQNYKQLNNAETLVLLEQSDNKSKEKAFLGNMQLVIKFINDNYDNLSLNYYDIDDLIQEGNIILLSVIEEFDSSKGKNFTHLFNIIMYQKLLRNIQPNYTNYQLPIGFKKVYCLINNYENDNLSCEHILSNLKNKLDIDDNKALKLYSIYKQSIRSYYDNTQTSDFNIEDELLNKINNEQLSSTLKEYINQLSYASSYVLTNIFGLDEAECQTAEQIAKSVNIRASKIRTIEKNALMKVRKYANENNLKRY